ncbi:YkvA family protein [Sphaerotilus montanus]|uniref:YkvA family protein n=1 Tax=Sphaerotilus montanus TaxID=522889 RepID=UPI003FA24962
MHLLTTARTWAVRIKRDGLTLWFALRDPRTPWLARALAWLVVAYALSPIDLIPDFIPVLGYLDDLLLLPGLIWLTLRLLPEAVLADCRPQVVAWLDARKDQPRSLFGAALVIALWTALAWYGWSAWQERA